MFPTFDSKSNICYFFNYFSQIKIFMIKNHLRYTVAVGIVHQAGGQ